MRVPRITTWPRVRRLVTAAVALVALVWLAQTSDPDQSAEAAPAPGLHDGALVDTDPADWVPKVRGDVSNNERVMDLVEFGDVIVAVGRFTEVREPGGPILTRTNAFAFDAETGEIDERFAPTIDGQVDAVIIAPDGHLILGGQFLTVNGLSKGRLVKLDRDGQIVTEFQVGTNKAVTHLELVGDRVYVGGQFTSIGAQPRDLIAVVDPTTGAVDPGFDFEFTVSWRDDIPLMIRSMEVTPDGTKMAIVGNFSYIDGQRRAFLAILDLVNDQLDPWYSSAYEKTCNAGAQLAPIWDVAISPDGSFFVTVATTFRGFEFGALCDAAARFELDSTAADVQPTWIDWTYTDSLTEVEITDSVVYVGGHMRWMNGLDARLTDNRGIVDRSGIAALDPINGVPFSWRADRSPRGGGVWELLATEQGLWVAGDSDYTNDEYTGKLSFLPRAGGAVLPVTEADALPTTLTVAGRSGTSAELRAFSFNGTTPQEIGVIADTVGIIDGVGGIADLGDELLLTRDDAHELAVQSFDGATMSGAQPLPLLDHGPDDWDLADVTGLYFDHNTHRIFYTLDGRGRLFWRSYTPESGLFEPTEHVIASDGPDWEFVRGMDAIDGRLYYGHVDGHLRSVRIDADGRPLTATVRLHGGPTVDGRVWDQPFFFDDPNPLTGAGRVPGPDVSVVFDAAADAVDSSFTSTAFDAAAGDEFLVSVTADDPTVDFRVFVTDPSNATLAFDRSLADSRSIRVPIATTGRHRIGLKVRSGSSRFRVAAEAVDADTVAAADLERSWSAWGDASTRRYQVFQLDLAAGDTVVTSVSWTDPTADVAVFITDRAGTSLAKITNASAPASTAFVAPTSDRYRIGVAVREGTTPFQLSVARANTPPTVAVGGPLVGSPLQTLSRQITTSDFDGDSVAVSIEGLPDGLVFEPATGMLAGTTNTVGRWDVAVTADDRHGGAAMATLRITTEMPDSDGDLVADASDTVTTTGPSIAQGGTATQSSDWRPELSADRAIDGDRRDDWRTSDSLAHTDSETDPWWEVDLGAETVIDGINLWDRRDCVCHLVDAEVLISDTAFGDVSAADARAQAAWSINIPGPAGDITQIDVPEISGRFVRVQREGASLIVNLAEVDVFAAPTPDADGDHIADADDIVVNHGRSLSQAGTATQSGIALATYGPENAIDGDRDPDWAAGPSLAQSRLMPDPWWELDLGQPTIIEGINIFTREGCSNCLADYELLISDRPFGNISPAAARAHAIWQTSTIGRPEPVEQYAVPAVAGRYVRIQRESSTPRFLTLREVDVFGVADADGDHVPDAIDTVGSFGRSIAQTGTASQVSDWQPELTADKAIDGDRRADWQISQSLAHTDLADDPWWELDLGSRTLIDAINLWDRNDCAGCQLSDVELLIGDKPFGDISAAAARAQAEWMISLPGPAPRITQVDVPAIVGRYVRVHREGTNIALNLAELDVYASPLYPTCVGTEPVCPITSLADVPHDVDGRLWFDFGDGLFEASVDSGEGGAWVLLLQYHHSTGSNPALDVRDPGDDWPTESAAGVGADLSGTEAWGHLGQAGASAIPDSPEQIELRWYASTDGHDRDIHFSTGIIGELQSDDQPSFFESGITSNYTPLAGHTSTIPGSITNGFADRGDLALTDFPFYRGGAAHWGVRGLGGRWEVDDFARNTTSTVHRVWVRACAAGTAADCPFTALADVPDDIDGRFWFDFGDGPFQASVDSDEGGAWVLLLQYHHAGGTDPTLNIIDTGENWPTESNAALGADLSGTESWGHTGQAAAAAITDEARHLELRWYAIGSNTGRVIHFRSPVLGEMQTDSLRSFRNMGIEDNFTRLGGHSANSPGSVTHSFTNEGDLTLTNFPWYSSRDHNWAIGGDGGRWEVDDEPGNSDHDTLHRVWVRSTFAAPEPVIAAPN